MKKTKKIIALGLIAVMAVTALTGCSKGESSGKSEFDKKSEIGVITREDGSGTKRTFPLAFGLECVIQWLFGRNIRAICRNHDFFVQYNDDAIFRRGWSRRLYGD